jgi:hypothetical protein
VGPLQIRLKQNLAGRGVRRHGLSISRPKIINKKLLRRKLFRVYTPIINRAIPPLEQTTMTTEEAILSAIELIDRAHGDNPTQEVRDTIAGLEAMMEDWKAIIADAVAKAPDKRSPAERAAIRREMAE